MGKDTMSELSELRNRQDRSQDDQDARFALARAQKAAYYAHKHLIEHPRQLDAQASYREANRRCDEAVAALREAEKRSSAAYPL